MSQAQSVAERYIAVWNETDPKRRRDLLAQNWAPNAVYVDPVMKGQGVDEISALIAGVHDRFAGFRFSLLGAPDGHADYVRFSWSLGPEGAEAPIGGSDVVALSEGRIHSVVGFLDKVPAA